MHACASFVPSFRPFELPSVRSGRRRSVQRISASSCSLPQRPLLVFVTPNGICSDLARAKLLCDAAIQGGADIVQLRDYRASFDEMISTTRALVPDASSAGRLVVSGPDSIRIAHQVGQGVGVHFRERDAIRMMDELAEKMDPKQILVGCSCHAVTSARSMIDRKHPPSYVQVGTMFPTESHPGKVPEGPELLRKVVGIMDNRVAVVGIGGLSRKNLGSVVGPASIGHGDGIAVISQIANAEEPEQAARELRAALEAAWSSP